MAMRTLAVDEITCRIRGMPAGHAYGVRSDGMTAYIGTGITPTEALRDACNRMNAEWHLETIKELELPEVVDRNDDPFEAD